MPYPHRIKGALVTIASLLTVSPQADMAYKSNTQSTHTQAVTDQAQSTQGKANRLLSGTVAYGTQYWSYAKVDWMEPIWQSQGKQLYTSLDYMNHLHKSNRHSHEIGSGLVLWQSLTSGNELGLGAYWLNYNSWHDLRHHGLRLGAKVIWQDWQLTGNGFFKLSKAKEGKPGQQMHPYFGSGLLGDEQILNGADMIIGKHLGRTHWQAMAYHYPKQPNQTSQLLSTGLGLQASLEPHKSYTGFGPRGIAKILFDKQKKHLLLLGASIQTNKTRTHLITKTDTDAGALLKAFRCSLPFQQESLVNNVLRNFTQSYGRGANIALSEGEAHQGECWNPKSDCTNELTQAINIVTTNSETPGCSHLLKHLKNLKKNAQRENPK